MENSPNVIWQGVGNLHGVNKLKSNSELNVSSGLTVIYGENGSGKSGYTRLLNNAFISRGDQDILPNIFETNQNRYQQILSSVLMEITLNINILMTKMHMHLKLSGILMLRVLRMI